MARSVLTTNNEGSSVHLFADKTVASADHFGHELNAVIRLLHRNVGLFIVCVGIHF